MYKKLVAEQAVFRTFALARSRGLIFVVVLGFLPADELSALTFAVRPIGNNVDNPEFGSAGSPLLRDARMAYGDRISAPACGSRKSAGLSDFWQ